MGCLKVVWRELGADELAREAAVQSRCRNGAEGGLQHAREVTASSDNRHRVSTCRQNTPKPKRRKNRMRDGPESIPRDGIVRLSCSAGQLQNRDLETCLHHSMNDGELSMAASDDTHVAKGLLAIDSYNGNAWKGNLAYGRRSRADALLWQECKVPKGSTDECEQAARTHRITTTINPCAQTEKLGLSAGTAVGVRAHIGLAYADSGQEPEGQVYRFSFRQAGMMCNGGVSLGSIYLINSIGVKAEANLSILQDVAGYLQTVRGFWIIGCDWSTTPHELEETGWLELVQGTVH